MDNLEKLLKRTGQSVTAAYAYYEMWYSLRDEYQALADDSDEMNDNRRVDFFHSVGPGSYALIFIELGCLFGTDDHSASIRNLKVELDKRGRNDLVQLIQQRLGAYRDLVSSVSTIRSKLMAHKETGASSGAVHKEYGVAPNDIKALIEECFGTINEVGKQAMGSNHPLPCATTTRHLQKDTFELMHVLRKGRS